MSGLTPAPHGYPIKLVRDNTPEILNGSGEPGELWYGETDPALVERFLRLKLAEEVAEFLVDGGPSELADVHAVVRALAEFYETDLESVIEGDGRGWFRDARMMYGRHAEFDGTTP